MQSKIVVIGSSNVDMIMKMDHLPARGETVTNAVYMQVFGGKGANQAVGAARAGGDVAFVSCVGDDAFAPLMVENFRKDGINTEYVFHETGIASGTALIMIGDKGDNYLSVAPGANYRLTPEYLDTCEPLISKAEILLLQFEILPDTLAYALRKAKEIQIPVIWNFAPARSIDMKMLRGIEILVVNEIESAFLTGMELNKDEDIVKAAFNLQEKGVKKVIITLGSRGSYILSEEFTGKIPAFKMEAVDTTAAGDVYCGALAAALTAKKSLKEAVIFASAASAISVTRMGAQPSAPLKKEIEDFLAKHQA